MEDNQHSTGLSIGKQADGLPDARHTDAVWAPHGVLGPAPIHALNKLIYKMIEIVI